MNQEAREWFGLLEGEPNLEHLARQARPNDIFMGLCASQGTARFSLNGLFVEGTSYSIPYESRSAVLVSIHRPQVTAIGSAGAGEVPTHTIDIFAELSRTMASNLDLQATLKAVLESVERLIPSDLSEVTIWDTEKKVLVPYRFVGLSGVDRRLEKTQDRYQPDQGYTGYLVRQRSPLMIGNIDTFREARPVIDRKQYPFNSYLGTPLLLAGELVGTLELASLNRDTFNQNDLEVLRILSGQAAVALHNAVTYEEAQRRVIELSGLAQLSIAVGALYDPKDLFSRLEESIKPLIDARVIGFWIYDEVQHILEAKIPFIGIPSPFLEGYSHIPIAPDSQADAILHTGELLVSTNASEDAKLEALGIAAVVQAAGMICTIMVPLTSAGRLIGYLHVADKIDGAPFDQNDLRLLSIIAGQAAMIIENATLVQQTQKRVQRAEALRRIASLTGSAATLEEIIQFALRELARLLQADCAALFLLDENRGELRMHKESLYGLPPEVISRLGRAAYDISKTRFAWLDEALAQRSFVTGSAIRDADLLLVYHPLVEAMQLQSIMVVPLVIRDRGIGEIFLGSCAQNFFDKSDVVTIGTAAGQLAGAIDQASLSNQTDETLRRRVDQLTALTRISRELNTSLDLQYLLQRVYHEILHTTRASCGSILLFDTAVDATFAQKTPRVVLAIGDNHAEELSNLERKVLEQTDPIIIDDFESQKEAPENGAFVQPPHEGIRSGLIVPIAYQEQVAGLIHLHASAPGCFDSTALEIAQTLAIQAAIALGNAQRYNEQSQRSQLLARRVEAMENLLETTRSLHLEQPLEQSLEAIAYGIQESTPFNIVLISLYEPASGCLKHIAAAGLTLEQVEEARGHTLNWTSIQPLLQPEFRLGHSYFIPSDKTPPLQPDVHRMYSSYVRERSSEEYSWDPDDMMLVPLVNIHGQPLGLISVDDPRDGARPDRPAIETLEIFASQAGLAIESFEKVQSLRIEAAGLDQEMKRAQQAAEAARKLLPALLHKDLEQTINIQRLSQRTKRIRAGLDIAELVNRQADRADILLALAREILTRMDFDIALVGEPAQGGPRLLLSAGQIPENVNPGALFGQKNPLRQSLLTGEAILVSNIGEAAEWQSSPLLQSLEAKAFACLPIPEEEADIDRQDNLESQEPGRPSCNAALLAICRAPLPAFTTEDEQLYALLARQVSIALQNIKLLNETNRRLQEVNLLLEFSRQLGSLDPVSILHTLVDSTLKVIPAGHGCMVALWDTEQNLLIPKVAAGYRDNDSIMEICFRAGEALPGLAFKQGQALRVDEVDFARHYSLPSENLLRYRNATEGRLPLSALVVPIGGSQRQGENGSSGPAERPAAPLGVLVLENFKSTAAFTADDQALIASLGQQTALTLENARLYQASEQRASQLRALTNVAATITSSLQSDELIASLLDQARTIIPYDTGTLWLRQADQLTVRAARGFADSEERVGISVAVEDSQLLMEMIVTGRPIYVADVHNDARFPSLIEHQYFSWLGVPLISKGEVVGVIALEKTEAGYYTTEHIQAITTFAGQAAVALENANLYEESVRKALELDQRSRRLAILNRLSTELSGSLDTSYILGITIQEIDQAISCSGVSAFMFETAESAYLMAEKPQITPNLPVQLPYAPLYERLRESLGIFSVEDILDAQEKITTPLLSPLAAFLQARSIRGLLVLPLATSNELHGLLLLYKDQPYRFSADEVELARTISNQAAVALQNAGLFAETQRLFAETRQRSAELATLFDFGVHVAQVLDQRQLVDITFENVLQLLQADTVLLLTKNDKEELAVEAIEHGLRLGPYSLPRSDKSFSQYVLKTGLPLVIGDVERDRSILPIPDGVSESPARSWMGVPLVVRGATLGVLAAQSDLPDQFTDTHIRLIAQVGNQLVVALDNAYLFTTVQSYAASLEQRVEERTAQLATEHHRTQTLLGIITELSSSLDMDQVLNRTLGLINESTSADHSMITLFNTDDGRMFMRAVRGSRFSKLKGEPADALKLYESLAGWVVKSRQSALIPDLLADSRWNQPMDQEAWHHSAIAVPLMMGEDILGALLLFHAEPGRFALEQLELIEATAKQIAVAINNSQLFDLIRDQAERLGDMLRNQHIETSRQQAILEAVADGVLVTDANRVITLFNASAEQILGLKRQQVLGQSLEAFSGLFGKAAQTWMETIHAWSANPTSFAPGDSGMTHAEQIILEDNRVVSVHMAPVRLRKDFLGTVSIFQDITHQVEVDRLKSEFVATVSHELRTPMTSIKGYVEILLMGAAGTLSDQQKHFLEIVKSNTERLAVLVNDLLDISRIEAGRVTLSLQPLDIRELASKAVNDLVERSNKEQKPMEVQISLPAELPRVMGDSQRVRQILDNLLENAYFYTPENGCILLTACQAGEEIQVDVRDNGIGIALKDQSRIFERFYRGEDPLVLATSGTGLGLSIVQRLVDMHKGRIWFYSSAVPGQGSTFSFTLPVYIPGKEE